MWLTIHTHHSNNNGTPWCVVTVHGQLDIATAPRLRDQLAEIAHRHSPHLIVDLADVTFCDSSGLAAFLATARRVALLDGELVLAAPSGQLRKVLTITGIAEILRNFDTVQAALQAGAIGGKPANDDSSGTPPNP